jgi:oligoendopeptidase F
MCTRDIHLHCQELRPIREVTENAKSSAAIVHIQRDLEDIVGTFEKIKSDITNNISEVDNQKRKCLSVFSDMRKLLNDQIDEIEKEIVEEVVSVEQTLQVKLKKVLVAIETKITEFDNIRQDVNKIQKYASNLQTFIGVNEMSSMLDEEVKKQKGEFNYELFELKHDFSSEIKSFVKDVFTFGVISVTNKHCSPVL